MSDTLAIKSAEHMIALAARPGGKPVARLFALNLTASPAYAREQDASDAAWYRADALITQITKLAAEGRAGDAPAAVRTFVDALTP